MACGHGNRISRVTSRSATYDSATRPSTTRGDEHHRLRPHRHVRAQPRVEGPGPLPRAALPRRDDRPAGQRTVRTLARPRCVRRPGHGGRARSPSSTTSASSKAVLAGICLSAWQALLTAALHPDRVQGVVAVAPWARDFTPPIAIRLEAYRHFDEVLDDYSGWFGCNRHYLPDHWPEYAAFFFDQMFPEPHSTKQLEDVHAYNCDTTGHVMLAENGSSRHPGTPEEAEALLRGIDRPVLVIQGTDDRCQPLGRGESVVRWTGRGAPRPRGRRPPADGTAPGRGQPCDQELRGQDHRCACPAAPPGRSARGARRGRSTSARRSGSGTCAATSPSPTRCASSGPTWRSSG